MGKRVVTHVVSLYLEEYSYYSSCMLLNIYSSNILIFPFIFYFDFILFRFHFSYDNENYHLLNNNNNQHNNVSTKSPPE